MVQNSDHMYAVIVAGGSGSRLWPLSRKQSPKQFLPILENNQSMFQHMYEVIAESIPQERIIIQTPNALESFIHQQLPSLPTENLFLEPERRDHGPAFSMAATVLYGRDPEATIGFFYADCIIKNRNNFKKTLAAAYQATEEFPNNIVTVGVKPTYPDTGYGYIQMGAEAKKYEDTKLFYVKRFTEKPDLKTAKEYIKSWEYLWNTGYKICTAKLFLDCIEKVDPAMRKNLVTLGELINTNGSKEEIAAVYHELPKASVEFFLAEKLDNLMVVPADLEWADISDWNSFSSMMTEISGETLVTRGNVVTLDTHSSLIMGGKKLIAAIGLKDIVVIDTDDALLITTKSEAQKIKEMVQLLEAQGKEEYL